MKRLPAGWRDILLLCAIALGAIATTVTAEQKPLVIGVLAHRGPAQATQAFADTAAYLSDHVPSERFVVAAYDLHGLESAVATGSVDFVITNPEQYIVLEARHRVFAIATLVRSTDGPPLQSFGGVIFTRSDRQDLQSLADLRGKTIATVDAKAFGGYLMQAGELLDAGVDVREQASLDFVGLPQDKIIDAVTTGRADAGFVRTGLIESLAREGKIDAARLRVLGARQEPGFPFRLSTPLYPEWPFAAMPGLSEELVNRVTIALLAMPADSEAARRGGYHGWTVDMSYRGVHDLMRRLRVAPYEAPGDFRVRDVLQKYDLGVVSTLSALLMLLLFLAGRFFRLNRALSAQIGLVAERTTELEREIVQRQRAECELAGESRILEMLVRDTPLPAVLEEAAKLAEDAAPAASAVIFLADAGSADLKLAAAPDFDDDARRALAAMLPALGMTPVVPANLRIVASENIGVSAGAAIGSIVLLASAGTEPVAVRAEELRHVANLIALVVDSKRAAERLRLSASVFDNAITGIVITDAENHILRSNAAYREMTGYSDAELVGRNPRMMQSGRHDQAFYSELWTQLMQHGKWSGEVWNRRKNGNLYPLMLQISVARDDQGKITHHVGSLIDISDLKETQARLERVANYDVLTGLPNRALLTDRLRMALSQARRNKRLLAVCFLDLDGFKPINDQYGHEGGDKLLARVAQRLLGAVRVSDTVGRLGGDEFVLLLTGLTQATELATSLARISASLAVPYVLDGLNLSISASIGITIFPHDDADPDTLLRHADQAMYEAKRLGRNRYQLFDAGEDLQMHSLTAQRKRFAAAIDANELRLYYQPKVNMRHGTVVGLEALVRWEHPERGLLPPGEFLPLIEQSDTVCDLGEWVLREALRQMEAWHEQGLTWPISVNIAARHFLHPNFVARLDEILKTYPDIPAGHLELEIVESAALEDVETMRAVIAACHRLWIGFALDDFGTGYSTLTYLKKLGADTLKIDQSFVRELLNDKQGLSIVDGIVNLAAAFEAELVAEGVETAEHGSMLLRLGCDLAQGYAIAPPMPAAAVPGWATLYRPDPSWQQWARHDRHVRDFALLAAEVEHRAWVDRLVAVIGHPTELIEREPIVDGRRCGFGRWYHGPGMERYANQPNFIALDRHHAQVHEIGRQMLDLLDADKQLEARQLVPGLEGLKRSILAEMAALQQISGR